MWVVMAGMLVCEVALCAAYAAWLFGPRWWTLEALTWGAGSAVVRLVAAGATVWAVKRWGRRKLFLRCREGNWKRAQAGVFIFAAAMLPRVLMWAPRSWLSARSLDPLWGVVTPIGSWIAGRGLVGDAAWTVAAALLVSLAWPRVRAGRCVECDYDLTGTGRESACPECGAKRVWPKTSVSASAGPGA